jgi:hypothetical protein
LAHIAEVFPELEGPEIVVVFQHIPYTQSIIRVYDFDGRVRYEIWHDALLKSCCACPQTGLLMFSGINGEAYWHERGWEQLGNSHPRVVFAIRPKLDTFIYEYMGTEPGQGTNAPVWYGVIYPIEFVHAGDKRTGILPQYRLHTSLGPPAYGGVVRVQLEVELEQNRRACGLSWDLDASGQMVKNSLMVSDLYRELRRRDPNTYPDPNKFRLGPLPPIVSRSTTAPADNAAPATPP